MRRDGWLVISGGAILLLLVWLYRLDEETRAVPMPVGDGWRTVMPDARAEDGSTLTIYPDTDNWSALQSFCDAHTAILFPDGNYPVSKCVNWKTGSEGVGRGMEATGFRMIGATGEPVFGLGGAGRWASSSGYGPATDVTLRGLTLYQTDQSSANCKCLFVNDECHRFTGRNLRFQGSYYEGVVAGSNCIVVSLYDIEAIDCGNGGSAYTLSTAGINATAVDLTIDGFLCRGCGQGVETGNTRVTVRNGTIVSPGVGTPSLGINIGSSGYGVYQTTVENVLVSGYIAALTTGNGIGRLAAVTIQNCDFDGTVTFQGGVLNNSVHHAHEGPDTEQSYFLNNIIRIAGLSSGPFTYNEGPTPHVPPGVLGREPLIIRGNRFYYDSTPQTTPTIGFAGEISAVCLVDQNFIYGLAASPSRGDVASFTNGSNPPIAGMPNLTVRNTWAFDLNGRSRSFSIQREGA